MTERLASAYDPDTEIGQWGWLWMDDTWHGIEWALVRTFDDEGEVRIEGWDIDEPYYSDTAIASDANLWRGAPYMPLSRPPFSPNAGAAVTVYMGNGASVSHSWAGPGAKADAMRERVLAAMCLPSTGEGTA